ncbi:MAG: apolipoprotein N-acyltransferase [Alphaproteobacteria bacterium]|nr:apolipoprotein N-acyltransferase [Alphaproteobacteria bacterium]
MTFDPAARVRDWGRLRPRWPGFGIAVAAGAVVVAAMPPLFIVPAAILGFVAAIWLLEGAAARDTPRAAYLRAAWLGWAFGFGFFVAGTYWLGEAFLVDIERTGWLTPFAVAGTGAGLAFFTAIGFAIAVWLWRRTGLGGPGRILTFAALWVLFEWLRGWILTGFPWNLLGTVWLGEAWMNLFPVAQAASLIGVYGLSLMTVIAAAAPALLAPPIFEAAPARGRQHLIICGGLTVLLPLALAAFGFLRLGLAPPLGTAAHADIRLRIVQANIDQSLKWRDDLRLQHLRTHLDMSGWSTARGSSDPDRLPPTHIVWPEAAVPFLFANDTEAAAAAGQVVPPGGALITGAMRLGEAEPGQRPVYNALHAIAPDGAILATYDKTHLVPFGEFVPLRGLLPFDRLVPSQGDLAPGPGLVTLTIEGLPPFAPLICYEAIFPGAVVAPGDRPAWLLNVTNDAWFGRSAGPHQHFAAARLRTIEEGLPLVRAANTGISAVVDAYGRVTARLGLGRAGILDADLPLALAPTLYARTGNWLVVTLLMAALASLLWRRRG